jgi:molybdopterin converting factor small subunit
MNVPSNLRQFTGGEAVVKCEGKTVGECLHDLARKFPGIEFGLFDSDGKLLHYLDVYVNLESSYPEELDKAVNDGDELHLTLFTVAGG